MASQPWSKILPSQLTQRPWVAYRYSSWCTFSIRMKRATNILTSRKRRVQRGLALAFHLEERISIESSCELEDHQRGDVKIWLCVVVLVVLCVDICWYSLPLPCGRFTKKINPTIKNSRCTDLYYTERGEIHFFSFFFYLLLSRFCYTHFSLMHILLHISEFKIFFGPRRPRASRIKTVKLDTSATICS